MTTDPVLVGFGVVTQREDDPLRAKEPLALMLDAVRAAGQATLLQSVGRVYVPQGRWSYGDPGRAIANTIGADDAVTVYANLGVLQQTLIGDACARIADGEIAAALVVGGEAGHRLLRSRITGVSLGETVAPGPADVVLRPAAEIMADVEVRALGYMPVGYYAAIDSAFRAKQGWSVDEHRDRLAALYGRFSEIAADNPHAWRRTPESAGYIRDASATNRMLAFPYTKLHNSSWNVDQAAALIFCSVDLATQLGIPRETWVYPLASTESNHMVTVSARADLGSCPGARIAGRAALDAAEVTVDELDLIELYSCFPVAVEIFADELGIPMDRDLTVTGGMPFAGGPFNNYVLQATCRMASLLRERPGARGLVSAVSGMLTKQGFGVWSSAPGNQPFSNVDVTSAVAAETRTTRVIDGYEGPARIAAFTVMYSEPGPRAVIVADVASEDARTVVESTARDIIGQMEGDEFCGCNVVVRGGEFTLA